MGRGKDKTDIGAVGAGAGAGQRRAAARTPEQQKLYDHAKVVRPLHVRMTASAAGKGTQEEQNSAKARMVRKLPPDLQRKLIAAAQEADRIAEETTDPRVRHEAQRLSNDAREVFILTHTGYVMQTVRKHVGVFDSEDEESARLILRQEAYLGLNDAVNDFQLTYADEDGQTGDTEMDPADRAVATAVDSIKRKKANPLTYASGKIRHRVGEAKEMGPTIAVKSRAFDHRGHVDAAIKSLKSQGANHPSNEQVAEMTGLEPDRVARLRATLEQADRLDARVGADADGATRGELIADTKTNIEAETLAAAEREVVREAAEALSPFKRRVVELHFNLAGGEEVEQKNLYDGVYRDPKTGELFSSEGTVISDRGRRDIAVAKESQRKLNERFAAGELVFDAGTPESFELAMLKKQGHGGEGEPVHPSREERLTRTITRETGTPMTSGQIQDAKDQALFELSQRGELQHLRPRYRGPNELENSLEARTMTRRALEFVGDITEGKGDTVKAGRAARDGSHKRGKLAEMAAQRGWLDDQGRVQYDKLRADVANEKRRRAVAAREAQAAKQSRNADVFGSSEDLAELMSS